jgi:ArsR family transcriptional regulator
VSDGDRPTHSRSGRQLAERLAQLESRVAALEQEAGENAAVDPPVGRRPVRTESPAAPESLAAAESPVDADAGEPDMEPNGPAGDNRFVEAGGQVRYSGDVTLHGRVVWEIALGAQNVLDLPNTRSPAVLAGLGHPTRVALTRRLLAGPATTAELQRVVEGSSTGQLYHHLRTMAACGLAEQDGRGQYRVPPTAVVPVMVLLLAAADIAGDLR